jgi:hypothetical protein
MMGMLATAVVAVAILLGSVLWATVTDMCKDEVRTRLGGLPYLLIRVASLRIPRTARSDMADEWNAELEYILRGTEGLPVTRLLRGVTYSADLLLRGARAVAREVTAAKGGAELVSGPALAQVRDTTWSSLFPEGRHIFYEGDDPTRFVSQVEAEFGFNPARDSRWGEQVDGDDISFISYSFHCLPEHLDAIYGSDRFPMGS